MNKLKLTSIRIFVAAFLLSGLMNFQASAAPFDLDATFGSDGKVTTPLAPHKNYARRVRIQPDGKIVTLGHSWGLGNFPFDFNGSFMTRHNPNGTIDPSFGTNGVVAFVNNFLSDFVILPDGKLMNSGYGGNSFALYRFNSDGTADTAFGNNGVVTTQVGGGNSAGQKIVLQSDGKLVVFGLTYSSGYSGNLAVVRYRADGTLDNGFGTNGILLTSVTANTFNEIIQNDTIMEFFGDAIIQPDGKLLVSVSNYNVSIVRLNANGTFDNTFGTNGVVLTNIYGYEDAPTGIALQTDGKILINGLAAFLGDIYYTTILRFNPNGTPDNSFGTNGKVTQSVSATNSKGLGAALTIQRDGKILTAGTTGSVFALSRYDTNGAIDNSFGANGILTTPIGGTPGINTIFSLAFQPNGKLVAAGSVKEQAGSYALGLVRYQSETLAPTRFDFDGDGRADVSVFRPADGIWYLNQSTNGFSATQFGLSTDKLVPADYDGDGKTDIAVYRNGSWFLQRSATGFLAVNFGAANDVPMPADYSGDGKADICVFRPSNGDWYISNLADNQFNFVQFGQAGDVPAPADYDGDGKSDVAVFRGGVWYLQRSQAGFAAVQFGNAADKPIVGDYDGDGKIDQAVFRGGTWYILGSTQGFSAVQFGLADDEPTAADYDGDGKTDIAVFRPSNGVWYLRQSQSGFNAVAFGTANDKPVPNAFIP